MRDKIISVVLIFAFFWAIFRPVIPFVQYYYVRFYSPLLMHANGLVRTNEVAKMENDGTAYLKALLKRVYEHKKKEQKKTPPGTVSVFVMHLNGHYPEKIQVDAQSFSKVTDFLPLSFSIPYVWEFFRPPNLLHVL